MRITRCKQVETAQPTHPDIKLLGKLVVLVQSYVGVVLGLHVLEELAHRLRVDLGLAGMIALEP